VYKVKYKYAIMNKEKLYICKPGGIHMRTKKVIVVPYDKGWPDEFEKIRSEISQALGDTALSIEHVGSTSVQGLWAKPIIDLDVVVADKKVLLEAIEKLEKAGYEYEGNLGIEGREAFKYEGKTELMLHHLYVCTKDSPELKRHMTFRDYLRTHPEAVEEYSQVKREGAKLYPEDIDSYLEYKGPVIEKIYRNCGLI
jgi:GrpB-like predicted nucleotidyltransferase (UPF0157 family)